MDVSNALLKVFCKICSRLYREEKGASAIEYVLIAAVAVGAVAAFSGKIDSAITNAGDAFTAAVSGAVSAAN